MADLTITTCRLVKAGSEHQTTAPAAADIVGGQAVRIDTNGKFELADASAAGTLGDVYVALSTVKAGMPVTAVKGPTVLDLGSGISGLAYGALVYVSDTAGTLSDTAGTVSKIVGTIVPGWAKPTAEKLLRVDL